MPDPRKKERLEKALQRQRWKCCWCGVQMKRRVLGQSPEPTTATAEHMVPQLFGGSCSKGNIRAACFKCNTERGNRMVVSMGKSNLARGQVEKVTGRNASKQIPKNAPAFQPGNVKGAAEQTDIARVPYAPAGKSSTSSPLTKRTEHEG